MLEGKGRQLTRSDDEGGAVVVAVGDADWWRHTDSLKRLQVLPSLHCAHNTYATELIRGPDTSEVETVVWQSDSRWRLVAKLAAELLKGGPAGGGPPFVVQG